MISILVSAGTVKGEEKRDEPEAPDLSGKNAGKKALDKDNYI